MNKTKKEIYADYKKEKDNVIKLKEYLNFWFGVDNQDIDLERSHLNLH